MWGLSVAVSPNGNRIASGGGYDKTVKVWLLPEKKDPMTLSGHDEYVSSVAFSPNGKQIVSGGEGSGHSEVGSKGSEIKVWDADTGKFLRDLKGHTGYVYSVAFSPNGSRIVAGIGDSTIRIWDASSGDEILKLTGHTDEVRCVALSADGMKLVSGSADRTLMIWDASTDKEAQETPLTLTGHTDVVNSVAFSPDQKWVVSGSMDRTVRSGTP